MSESADKKDITQERMKGNPRFQVKLPKTDKVAEDFPTFTAYLDYLSELDKTDPLGSGDDRFLSRIGLNLKAELDAYDREQEQRARLAQVMEMLRGVKAGAASADTPVTGTPNLTTREGLAAHMRAAKSESDWNNRIEAVKRANGGDYPNFWFATVIMSGLAAEVQASW
jgi:hypothetical protein